MLGLQWECTTTPGLVFTLYPEQCLYLPPTVSCKLCTWASGCKLQTVSRVESPMLPFSRLGSLEPYAGHVHLPQSWSPLPPQTPDHHPQYPLESTASQCQQLRVSAAATNEVRAMSTHYPRGGPRPLPAETFLQCKSWTGPGVPIWEVVVWAVKYTADNGG